MSINLLRACELNEPKLPKFVLIQENSGADASFLLASLIGNCLKSQQNGVVTVCLHHIYQHYTNAAARLGYNISMARDQGRIVILEPLADIGQQFLSSKYLVQPKEELVKSLLQSIKQETEQLLQSKENVTVIIDSITALVDLGYPRLLLLQLCHQLIDFASDRISIVLKVNLSNLYGDFISSLDDYANSNYLIRKMKSGEFHEVDGNIIYKKRNDNLEHTSKTILYKVGDKNVKIFQPGEVGVRS